MSAPFRIGLLGLGHVGGALAARLGEVDRITAAAGRPIVLEAVSVARPAGRHAPARMMPADALLTMAGLDAIVELIGGLEPARTLIAGALEAGRQVITANKQVIAAHGPDLARLGPLRFEAAVASAVPIVEMLAETLAADQVRSVTGVLNGTTNAMLDAMMNGIGYEEALFDAQRRGLAEADPTADVDAHDPAAKLTILAMLAFRRRIDPATIARSGIRELGADRLRAEREQGRVVRLIAVAIDDGGGLQADVRPRLVPADNALARVAGPMNGIAIEAAYAGALYLEGPGAGPEAAASAVLADLVRAARAAPAAAGGVLAALAGMEPAPVTPLGADRPYPAAS